MNSNPFFSWERDFDGGYVRYRMAAYIRDDCGRAQMVAFESRFQHNERRYYIARTLREMRYRLIDLARGRKRVRRGEPIILIEAGR